MALFVRNVAQDLQSSIQTLCMAGETKEGRGRRGSLARPHCMGKRKAGRVLS